MSNISAIEFPLVSLTLNEQYEQEKHDCRSCDCQCQYFDAHRRSPVVSIKFDNRLARKQERVSVIFTKYNVKYSQNPPQHQWDTNSGMKAGSERAAWSVGCKAFVLADQLKSTRNKMNPKPILQAHRARYYRAECLTARHRASAAPQQERQ